MRLTEVDGVDRGNLTSQRLHHERGHRVADIAGRSVSLAIIVEAVASFHLPVDDLQSSQIPSDALSWLREALDW